MGGGGAINKPGQLYRAAQRASWSVTEEREVGITEPVFQELPLKLNISYFRSLKKTANSCFPIEKRVIVS